MSLDARASVAEVEIDQPGAIKKTLKVCRWLALAVLITPGSCVGISTCSSFVASNFIDSDTEIQKAPIKHAGIISCSPQEVKTIRKGVTDCMDKTAVSEIVTP